MEKNDKTVTTLTFWAIKPCWLRWVLICCLALSLVLIVIGVLCFVCKFKHYETSNGIAEWGQFGDYFGGILNPLLSLIGICITVYIAVIIQNYANRNSQNEISIQYEITKFEIRNTELMLFRTTLTEAFKSYFLLMNDATVMQVKKGTHIQGVSELIKNFRHIIDSFKNRAEYLFELSDDENIHNLEGAINVADDFEAKGEYLDMSMAMKTARGANEELLNDLTQFMFNALKPPIDEN